MVFHRFDFDVFAWGSVAFRKHVFQTLFGAVTGFVNPVYEPT